MATSLSLILSGVMALAGLHTGNIRGVRQWALAYLLFSIGMALAFTPFSESPWVFVVTNPLIAASAGLMITGIQAFEERQPDWRIPIVMLCLSVVANFCVSILTYNIAGRVISNSLILGIAFAICARSLLIKIDPPLRTAYWLTGSTFVMLTLLAIARIQYVIVNPPKVNFLLSPNSNNMMVFFGFNVLFMLVGFGFVLMLNYRLATDLRRLATRDSLTSALNRRSLEEIANQLQAHLSRSGGYLSVLMLDIDHFKTVNDRYGHPVGDAVLIALSTISHTTIRTGDYFARYGGEEFCILLPGTTEAEACILANRLRQAFSEIPIDCGRGELVRCTVSIGASDSSVSGLDFEKLIAHADAALYQAKHAGRNCVVPYSQSVGTKSVAIDTVAAMI